MPKKFVPEPELLNTILTRYKETKNYSQVSRETNISASLIKRIISENSETAAQPAIEVENPVEPKNSKPKTATQVLAARKEYIYTGPAPVETILPTKAIYYGQIVDLVKEYLNV